MKLSKISHIGMAVKKMEPQLRFYQEQLGMELINEEVVADQMIQVAMLRIGESTIELLCPTDEKSPVAKFLAKRGEGIHHVAYEVSDLDSALEELAEQGVRLIDKVPRAGAHGKRIAFVHPAAAGGVLTELCE